MAYVRPTNTVPLSPGAKLELLSQYGDFYRELARTSPGELNKKLPRCAVAGSLDRIGAVIFEEAEALAARDAGIRQFLDENRLPDKMTELLPDDFRVFCLLLNSLKQWLSAEQAATDRYLLGGTARAQCRSMVSSCLVTGEPLTGEVELHHPVRDGRPPLPLSKEGHRIIEEQTVSGGPSEPKAPDEIARIISEIKKPNESWRMLRRGCRLILGLSPGGGTPTSNASAKFAGKPRDQKNKLAPAGTSALDGRGTARALSSAVSTGRKSASPSAANCRLRIGLCPTIWNDTFCPRLLWPFGFIAVHPSPAARRRCVSTPLGTARRQQSDERRNAATPPDALPNRASRIEMNVVQMRRQIAGVADRVLPVSSLPDAAFARRIMTGNRGSLMRTDFKDPFLIARQRPGKSASPSGKSLPR